MYTQEPTGNEHQCMC